MKKLIVMLVVLAMTGSSFAALTGYKHYDTGLGSWDQTVSTSTLWSDWAGTGGALTHVPGGNGSFPAGNPAFAGCVDLTPPAILYHHDYDDVIWSDTAGTWEAWVSPHWDGQEVGGPVQPGGTTQDFLIGDGAGEFSGAQGFNFFLFSNGVTPGFQFYNYFTDNDGLNAWAFGSTNTWEAGSWHHITVSWDASNVMYGVDGVVLQSKARNGGFNFAQGGYMMGIGAPRNSWDGWADDIAVWSTGKYAGAQGTYTVPTAPAPEPATIALLGLGALALLRKRS